MNYFYKEYVYLDRLLVFIILFSVLLTISPPGLALDPHKKITQYIYDVWEIEHGLPQATVNAISRTRDGYLWLGTQEGLVRFDGARFEIFNKYNVEQILDNRIWSLYEDREGMDTGSGKPCGQVIYSWRFLSRHLQLPAVQKKGAVRVNVQMCDLKLRVRLSGS
jgi:hypothetical protein